MLLSFMGPLKQRHMKWWCLLLWTMICRLWSIERPARLSTNVSKSRQPLFLSSMWRSTRDNLVQCHHCGYSHAVLHFHQRSRPLYYIRRKCLHLSLHWWDWSTFKCNRLVKYTGIWRYLSEDDYWRIMSEQRLMNNGLDEDSKENCFGKGRCHPNLKTSPRSIVEYVRSLQTYIERANRFPLRQLNSIIASAVYLWWVGYPIFRTSKYLRTSVCMNKKMVWYICCYSYLFRTLMEQFCPLQSIGAYRK